MGHPAGQIITWPYNYDAIVTNYSLRCFAG
jgi:hypothetical protein